MARMTNKQPISPELAERHNKLYQEGFDLLKDLVRLDDVGGPTWTPKKPGFFAQSRLHKAIKLFRQALEINESNWGAMLFVAKAYQALLDFDVALQWTLRAHELAPDNIPIAVEAGGLAGTLGKLDISIQVTERVLQAHPSNAPLHFNLGITQILVGRPQAAVLSFERAMHIEPDRPFNRKLLDLAKKIEDGSIPCPRTQKDISIALKKMD